MAAANASSTAVGTGNQLLNVNAGIYSQLLHDAQASVFKHVGWTKHVNYHSSLEDVDPMNTPALGGRTNFEIPPSADKVGRIQLIFTLSYQAFARAGAAFNSVVTDPYASFVGGVGYHAIEELKVRYASNTLQTIEGDEMMIQESLRTPQEEAFAKDVLTGLESGRLGIDDDKVKQGLAAGGVPTTGGQITPAGVAPVTVSKTCVVDLPVYWRGATRMYVPYSVLANRFRVQVKWRQMQELIDSNLPQTSGGGADPAGIVESSFAISDVKLRVDFIHLTDSDRLDMEHRINNTEEGELQMFSHWETQKSETIAHQASPLTSHDIKLTNLRGPASALYFVLRKKIYITPNPSSLAKYSSVPYFFIDVDTMELRSSTGAVVPQLDHRYDIYHLRPLYHTSKLSTLNIYFLPLSVAPEADYDALGHKDFGNLHNPILRITRASGLTGSTQDDPPGPYNNDANAPPGDSSDYDSSDVQVDVYAWVKNWVHYAKGDVTVIFN